MHIKPAFDSRSVAAARAIVRAAPFATIVTPDLRATHMPCLVEEGAPGLEVLGHVALADPAAEALAGPLLAGLGAPGPYANPALAAAMRDSGA